MNTNLIRALAGAAALAAGAAGAQVYSPYPTYGYATTSSGLVRCESTDSRRRFCRADTRGGVQVYRQLSRQDCIRGRNWEATADGILVADGCRADFAVGSRYGATPYMGTDRYGRPIYDGRTSSYGYGYGYGNGYQVDRYGRRIYVGTNSGYGYDRYGYDRRGDRIYTGNTGYDGYGDRVWVQSGAGGYYTDRYGRRIYDEGYDSSEETYERNRDLGYGGAAMPTTLPTPMPVSTSTYGSNVIYCQAAPVGRTYCGDRTVTYTLTRDNSNCLLERTYGRDSYGTWVSGGCNLRLENRGY